MQYIVLLILIIGLLLGRTASAELISLQDKIGQMLIVGFDGKYITQNSPIAQSILNGNVGGVLLFNKNIESPEQVKQLNASLQDLSNIRDQLHLRQFLPLLIAVDYEGGKVVRLKNEDGFPVTISAADVGQMSISDANIVARNMALTLQQSGFNLDFAPDIDVNVNKDNPIIGKLGRSFSDQPSNIFKYASLYSKNFLMHGVECAYKHFPGQGSADADSHVGFVDVTNTWKPYELDPYASLLSHESACGMVMTAHIVNRQLDNSGLPATLSSKILTGILRDKLHFDGVIITDDMQMLAITQHYGLEQSVILAINAGADMFIFGNQLTAQPQNPTSIINIIVAAVNAGKISQSRIDEAYRHIIKFKQSVKNRGI